VPFQDCTEVYTGLGRRGVRAEAVAGEVVTAVRARLADGAAVGEHLADQLLLPMALGAGGVFTTARITAHVASNAQAIRRFLPVGITFREVGGVMEVEVKT
jgi:RNA 3'-terminal phosphate cyclase (ATP)